MTEEINVLQVMLLEEVGDIRGHGGVRVGFGMWRVAVVSQILDCKRERVERLSRDSIDVGLTKVNTGMPSLCANILASDRQFCFEPLYPHQPTLVMAHPERKPPRTIAHGIRQDTDPA